MPLAIVALCGFIAGGILAIKQLRTRSREWDMRSYVAIHLSIVFAVGALLTGSIWAKASWGHWWVWDEPVLVSFLIVFLLYCCYQPLRFSIEDPEKQARYASVFAIAAGAFVPINFAAVRLATAHIHPRVLSKTSGNRCPSEMFITFLVSLLGVALLFLTLWKVELTAKNSSAKLKKLRQPPRGRARSRRPPRPSRSRWPRDEPRARRPRATSTCSAPTGCSSPWCCSTWRSWPRSSPASSAS